MRKGFHEELKELKKDVVELGRVVRKSIAEALKAVEEGNLDLASQVMKNDDLIDQKVLAIEEHGIGLVARQAPVARDLRLLHSILFIGTHLERMGDLAFNIARAVKHLVKKPEKGNELMEILREMGRNTLNVVDRGIEAFEKNDLKIAEELPQLDEPIDKMFKEFFKLLAQKSTEEHSLNWASNMVLICRWLERIADHAVDIGERVTYLVTGEIVEPD